MNSKNDFAMIREITYEDKALYYMEFEWKHFTCVYDGIYLCKRCHLVMGFCQKEFCRQKNNTLMRYIAPMIHRRYEHMHGCFGKEWLNQSNNICETYEFIPLKI